MPIEEALKVEAEFSIDEYDATTEDEMQRAVIKFANCGYRLTLDPRMEPPSTPRPKIRSPLFIVEQVFNPNKFGFAIMRSFKDELEIGEAPIFVNNGRKFGQAQRRRVFPTNVRRIPALSQAEPAPGAPSTVQELCFWPADKEWPSWCQQVYPEGKATSVVHTKQVQSWITLNTECVTPLRESHDPFKAVYDAKFQKNAVKYCRKFHYLPDANTGLPRVMTRQEALTLMGFPLDHFGGVQLSDRQALEHIGESFLVPQVTHICKGIRNMQDANEFAKKNVVVVSLFGGIAADALALKRAGVLGITRVVYCEKDRLKRQVAKLVWKKHFPEASFEPFEGNNTLKPDEAGSILNMPNEIFEDLVNETHGNGGEIVVIGGSPCTEVSLFNRTASASSHSFERGESALFYRMASIIKTMSSRKKDMIINDLDKEHTLMSLKMLHKLVNPSIAGKT
ncbi:E3 ubiquitin transferase [Pycnococcus provasolii]